MTDKPIKDSIKFLIKLEEDINDFLLDMEEFESRLSPDFSALMANTRDLRKDIKKFRKTIGETK